MHLAGKKSRKLYDYTVKRRLLFTLVEKSHQNLKLLIFALSNSEFSIQRFTTAFGRHSIYLATRTLTVLPTMVSDENQLLIHVNLVGNPFEFLLLLLSCSKEFNHHKCWAKETWVDNKQTVLSVRIPLNFRAGRSKIIMSLRDWAMIKLFVLQPFRRFYQQLTGQTRFCSKLSVVHNSNLIIRCLGVALTEMY